MTNKTIAILVLSALGIGLVTGRYTAMPDKVTHTDAVEDKSTEKKNSKTEEHKIVTSHEVKSPDGTITTDTKIETEDKVNVTDAITSDNKSTETTVTENSQGVTVGPLIGLSTHSIGPVYGLYADKQFIGPIHINATFLTSPTFGIGCFIGAGIQFK